MARGRSIDAEISRLAAPTASVVHARRLRAAGISRDAVLGRVRSGWMAALLPRTYAVGPLCESPTSEMRQSAGVLFAGPGSRLDGEAAAERLGLWDRSSGVIAVAVRGARSPQRHDGYEFRRCLDLPNANRATPVDGAVPIVAVDALIVRLCSTLTAWQVAFVIGRAIYRRLTTLEALQAIVRGRTGCRWVVTLRHAVDLVRCGSAGTRGVTEDALLERLLEAGVPEPVVNTRGALGLSRDEPDFWWPERRLNVEVDGRHHDSASQRHDDAARDLEARRLGVRVVRVEARDVLRRLDAVVCAVRRSLAGEPIEVDPQTRRLRLP